MKKDRKWKRLRALGTLVLLAICLYSAAMLVHYAASSISTRQTNRQLQAAFEATEEISATEAPEFTAEPTSAPEPRLLDCYQYIGDTLLPSAERMLAENPDTVAWINIPGGVVNLPVVYRDNTYYLDHDFYGRESISGTLFLDENHPFLVDTQYLVIHGHAMYDGSMFGLITHYRSRDYMEAHPTVYLNTLYRQEAYEVIGVLFVPADVQSEGYVPYIGMRKFASLEQFSAFAEIIRSNALHWKDGAQLQPDDAILALSTCYEENRVVVICRRTSAG